MKNNQEVLNQALNDLKSDALEERLSQSYSSIQLIRDYLSVLSLNYRNKYDRENLVNLSILLFDDGVVTHFDELLESASRSLDDVLKAIIDTKDNE